MTTLALYGERLDNLTAKVEDIKQCEGKNTILTELRRGIYIPWDDMDQLRYTNLSMFWGHIYPLGLCGSTEVL